MKTLFMWLNQQVDGITDRSVTYGQLRDQSRALAIRLQKVFNLKFNDTIAVCLPNSIEFPTITLAGNEAGVIVTTVNPIYTPRKLDYLLIELSLIGNFCVVRI